MCCHQRRIKVLERCTSAPLIAGGGTTAEIAYRGLPAVFDATQGLLHWEDLALRL